MGPLRRLEPARAPTCSRRSSRAVPFNARGARRHKAPRGWRSTVPIPRSPAAESMSTQEGFGRILNELGARGGVRRPHRHHLARRHRVDQPRRLGEPARHLRPPRHEGRLPRGEGGLGPALGDVAGRASTSSSASPRTTCSWLLAAMGLSHSAVRRPPAAGRHALRPVHPARARCAELRLLPGCALPAGGDAVGHQRWPRRAARTSRSPPR